jgi:four helix bundle protein
MATDNRFAERLLEFAANIIKLTNHLNKTYTGRHLAMQLMRAATSAGANWEETCGAESRPDYLHKMQIVLKELRESTYWIKLIIKADLLPQSTEIKTLHQEATELTKIIAKSVITAKSR